MYIGLHTPDSVTDEPHRPHNPVGPEPVTLERTVGHYNRQKWAGSAAQPNGPPFVEPAQESDYKPCAGLDLF